MLFILFGLILAQDNELLDMGKKIELGTFQAGTTQTFAIPYENRLDRPVELSLFLTTCRCSVLPESTVMPDLSTYVFVPAKDKGFIVFELYQPGTGEFIENVEFFAQLDGYRKKYIVEVTGKAIGSIQFPEKSLTYDLKEQSKFEIKAIGVQNKAIKDIQFQADPPVFDWKIEDDKIVLSPNEFLYHFGGGSATGGIGLDYTFEDRRVKETFEFKVSVPNPCKVDPEVVMFGRILAPQDRLQKVVVVPGDVEITGVLSSPEYLKVRYGKRTSGDYIVYLQLEHPPQNFSKSDPSFKGQVLLTTTKYPLRIPFGGKILNWGEDTPAQDLKNE